MVPDWSCARTAKRRKYKSEAAKRFLFFLKDCQYDNAKSAYGRVLERDPNHAKVLQQLGWLHHQQSSSFQTQERAIEYLEKSVAAGKNIRSEPLVSFSLTHRR